jgi:hypothetical protein
VNVLWLGGGCGAGKTTLARRLAYRFDLRFYPVDGYAFAHEARATPDRHPHMAHAATLDLRTRHVTPTVQERVDGFVAYAREQFTLILEDLTALGDGPLILAEGPWLLPSLVEPLGASPERSAWLLPTPEFTARSLGIRNEPRPTGDQTDKERADRLRLARDAELTVLVRSEAAHRGLPVYEVDGSRSVEETEELLARHFAAAIERGPRMRDGAERSAIRRAENAVVNVQLASFRAYLGENAPDEETPFPYVCECPRLGCGETVPLTPSVYRAADGARAHG